MPEIQSHISFSILAALIYAFVGYHFLPISPEHIFLAAIIVIISGMLPDIDATGGIPERELGGLLAVIVPLLIVESFPEIKAGGVARVALVVICSYLFTRLVVVRGLQKYTIHRGMIHSIPAAIITFELVFLLFWDSVIEDRLYLASAALVGYLSHLLLDGWNNVDLVGRAMGKPQKGAAAMKILGPTWGKTFVLYGTMIGLAWVIARDFYPSLRVVAGVKY